MRRARYFGHVSLAGVDPFERMTRAHVRYLYAAENLALDSDAATAARALFASTPHRHILLDPHFRKIGIGVVARDAGAILLVEEFSD
jgi:uncharacterized protein YkwD